jgi:hypothetical protein
LGAGEGSEAVADFGFRLDHPDGLLGDIVRELDLEVGGEPEELVLALSQPQGQVAGRSLLAGPGWVQTQRPVDDGVVAAVQVGELELGQPVVTFLAPVVHPAVGVAEQVD